MLKDVFYMNEQTNIAMCSINLKNNVMNWKILNLDNVLKSAQCKEVSLGAWGKQI